MGKMTLVFENKVGNSPLVLESRQYKNATGENFSVTTLNYFISNIKLINSEGEIVSLSNQYFLVRQTDSLSRYASVRNVPLGIYDEIIFTVGIDSLKNVSPLSERTGVLDEASYGEDAMYWAWNSGYIFLKLQGISSVAPLNAAGSRKFMYHIGGFGGMTGKTANNLRQIRIRSGRPLTVSSTNNPSVGILFDLLKLFDGKKAVRIKEVNTIHTPNAASEIIENLPGAFSSK